ncbi:hypothetical protein [Chryseobacterium culicis]|uniref:Uncharacterized protein n=1 Tax=Chryseobacterium culicis TaxID=680127 RepID=A0A1H6H2X6_CHRCI|nr:hypothetical protein [Chryseobacterium culicis]SEH29592.1 hypothetical protein SAMN05421593_1104 [Chryseobacterium culicis]
MGFRNFLEKLFCKYVQSIKIKSVEMGNEPNDAPDCYLTDLQQMEDECAAPFENPILAGMW